MLTIYTITYNRAYLLERLYQSIIDAAKSSPVVFEWLVIDNGSTDSTSQLLRKIENDGYLKLRSIVLDENIGFTRADNIARSIDKYKYSSRIDDDDVLMGNYFELFIKYEVMIRDNKSICGLMTNCVDENGLLIGTEFKEDYMLATDFEVYHKYGIVGDKVRIYKTAIRDAYISEVFQGELLVPTELIYNRMGTKYKHLCVNEAAVIREYNYGGITLGEIGAPIDNNLSGVLLNFIELIRYPAANHFHRFKYRLHFLKKCFLCNMNFLEIKQRADGDSGIVVIALLCYLIFLPSIMRRKRA